MSQRPDRPANEGPRWARRLLYRVIGAPDAEAIVGDIEEGFAAGRSRAWYWRQTFGAIALWWRHSASGAGWRHDLRLAARKLRRRPAFSAVVVMVLALGIGANAAIFSIFNGVLLTPLPYPEPERLVVVETSLPSQGVRHVPASPPEFDDVHSSIRAFERMGGVWYRPAALTDAVADPEDIDMAFVTAGFLPTMGVEPLLGRYPTLEEDISNQVRVIVLSEGLWRRRYGADPDIVGKAIDMDDSPHTVVGVMPASFRMYLPPEVNMPAQPQAWVTFGARYEEYGRTFRTFTMVARLNRDATLAAANTELAALGALTASEFSEYAGTGYGLEARPLDSSVVANARPMLMLLLGAVGLVLLTVCANVANLYLAQAAGAQQELAVRRALGASRARLMRGIAIECALITVIGAGIGILLAIWIIEALPRFAPADLPRLDSVALDFRVVAFAGVLAAGTALLFAAISGLGMNGSTAAGSSAKAAGSTTTTRLRNTLLTAELAFSLILLVGVGLLVRSMINLAEVDPGFDARGVVTMKLSLVDSHFFYAEPEKIATFYRELSQQASDLPGVTAAGITTYLPTLTRSQKPYVHETEAGPTEWGTNAADYRHVTPGWIEAMGGRLLSGRLFEWTDDLEHPNVVIVDDVLAAAAWPGENPVGRRIQVEMFRYSERTHEWAEVVGVVQHMRNDPAVAGGGQVFIPHGQTPMRTTVLTIRSDLESSQLNDAIGGIVRGLDGDQPVGVATPLSSYVRSTLSAKRFALTLLAAFAALATILATIGTYAVVSYGVAQRTREIGVQLAIGAAPRDVVRGVVAPAARLAGVGIGLGLIGAVAMARSLSGLLYGVAALDPATFLTAATLLMVTAILACWLPARRAAALDPTTALRHD